MRQFIIITLLLLITGCQGKTDPIHLKPITLSEAYPGSIMEVDKIELLDGSSGERKIIENKGEIKQWISKIKDIKLNPEDKQEGRVGYIFGISLYEGEKIMLGFIPNQINKMYYKTNIEFEQHIRTFFEEQFGRKF
ncbi:hypothetical protein SAMN03159341_1366 [Paenibacillus sp. 1_12]|uniref:hypothetical protein n=1 Tax=Paenibacillus sp. 1_12 TaxID=1566278 RepID=UPI0008E4FB80|nr:hypothetical protein [Paenibacillus sp. 1_12]SFM46848.1 hypothetical protein SAMN03159341_1366 [Paenibacillus sp. 1_12]